MSTLIFIIAVVLALTLATVWIVARSRRIRREAQARETDALAAMLGGTAPPGEGGETLLGLPDRGPAKGGIEVAEVVDLDALLAGEPGSVAQRARVQLEEPTNIDLGSIETVPLLPPRAPVLQLPTQPPARAAIAEPRVMASAAAAPPQRAAAVATAERAPSRPVEPPRPVPPARPGADVPLRELALAWFEARGYRSSPASAAVRPIELVLRHKDDPARAYAFVVEAARVSTERVQALRAQARSIGLVRLLIVAAGGAAPRAAEGFKGVRLMDRMAIEGEFRQLDITVAAKIIAVARKRAGALATAASQ